MSGKPAVKWLAQPQKHDYPAAQTYLNLLRNPKDAAGLAARLRKAPMSAFMARDILRASGEPLMGSTDFHVRQDGKKIQAEVALSPVLLVRDSVNGKVVIADGNHRLCCVYGLDPNAVVPCKIV
ncbi:MAG: hypothetical protein ACYDBQ_10305 [Thermoplasmatota archaeon]